MTDNPVFVTPTASVVTRKWLLKYAWIDRDTGWLQFNQRVLSEAFDHRTPLLERVKFLAIFSSNLDEFFMKRVSVLRNSDDAEDDESPESAAEAPGKRLARVRAEVSRLLECVPHSKDQQIAPGDGLM